MECPVCLENKRDAQVKTLGCKHQVCVQCWARMRTCACPLCRQVHTDTHTKTESAPPRQSCFSYLDAILEGQLYTQSGRQIQVEDLFP
jgi:hypothetical protein